jgi:hypothetical protein
MLPGITIWSLAEKKSKYMEAGAHGPSHEEFRWYGTQYLWNALINTPSESHPLYMSGNTQC